jgi:two-component system, NtrC family, sensor kinase
MRDKEVALISRLFSRWSIRRKLLFCLAIALVIVGALAYSGFSGVYSYRELARSISVRASELPLAGDLSKSLGDLRVTLSKIRQARQFSISELEGNLLAEEFPGKLAAVEDALARYRRQLEADLDTDIRFGDRSYERKTITTLEQSLKELRKQNNEPTWLLEEASVVRMAERVEEMYDLAGTLPRELHDRMHHFAQQVKSEYRTWILLEWTATIGTGAFLLVVLYLFYDFLFRPLNVLIAGSRRIAQQDDFDHRIHLRSNDEMAELATALNDMTARFQEIRSDLDEQVQQRTKEVVRSEQLASVGFLAAGVAHEINNPLASIAWSAESLESRLHDILNADAANLTADQQAEIEILRKYLRRIQDEAFRCKGITEKLLDFSRLGDVEKQNTDLGELVQGVIEMIRHLGKYREKKIELIQPEYVVAPVNAQELKQVVLNLITNALDSLDPSGTVWVSVKRNGQFAELVVRDNGCGMSGEVLRHLFEPFFTRKRDGSGTGLGLSITWRIVADHGGTIEPASDGPGKGARMRVLLPLVAKEKVIPLRKPQSQLAAA